MAVSRERGRSALFADVSVDLPKQAATRTRRHEIAVPVLVMVGEEDTETPPAYAEAITSRIDGARLVVVPGAGHLLNLEAPDTVNDLLRGHWHQTKETP